MFRPSPLPASRLRIPAAWSFAARAFGLLAAGGLIAGGFSACLFGGSRETDPEAEVRAQRDRTNRKIQALVDFYAGQTAELRGLELKRPVYGAVRTREEYRRAVEKNIEASLSPDEDALFTRYLAQFGWLPDTVSPFGELVTDYEVSAPAGYYLPGKDSLYVLSEYVDDEEQMMKIIPHELAHALQDQHFGFWDASPEAGSPYDYDYRLWRRCLVEGDAYFVGNLYIARYIALLDDPGPAALGGVEERRALSVADWLQSRPPNGLFLPQVAPYQFAPAMVGRVHAQGGWEAVNALYGREGLSTRYVFDPLDPRSELVPDPIDFDTSDAWGREGSLGDGGTFGPIDLLALLGGRLDSAAFVDGLGWTGDRYQYRWQPGQPFGAWAWALAFEDSARSEQAFEALTAHFRARGGGGFRTWSPGAGDDWPVAWDSPRRQEAWEKSGLKGFGLLRGRTLVFCENLPDSRAWLESLTFGFEAGLEKHSAAYAAAGPKMSRWKAWMAKRHRDKVYVLADGSLRTPLRRR